jgi:RNA polymerase sigma factor (TIGR02999 family)
MRHVLVDHARRIAAAKRGGAWQRVTLHTGDGNASPVSHSELLDLDGALDSLEAHDPRLARVVEYKYFAGMTIPEIAAALDVSEMTVSNDWRRTRIRLSRTLGG